MGAAACAVADLNKDGRPDIACIDSTRLKWYENRRSYNRAATVRQRFGNECGAPDGAPAPRANLRI